MQIKKPVTKPRKQRRMLFQAPDHLRHKRFAARLSQELRSSHGVKAIQVRNGDTVQIMRGDRKGFEGKVTRVDRRKYRIYVEGLTREKVDGTTIFVPVHPSKVMITRLDLGDKWRKKILERKREARKRMEGVEEIPPEKPAEKEEKAAEEKVSPEEKTPKETTRTRRRTKTRMKKREKAKKESRPKTKKTRSRRKTTKKTKGEK